MLQLNPQTAHIQDPSHRLTADERITFGAEAAARVPLYLRHAEGPQAPFETPLRALPGLADALGLSAVHVKDESPRLGLGSFKALGGAYAVARLVLETAEHRLGRPLAPADLWTAPVRAIAETLTFTCATDGNHGRSVAHGAAQVGARAVIFVHPGVSAPRRAAMAAFGATITEVPGSYDDSVAAAARVAAARGWILVSDTAWPEPGRVPTLVMQGYGALAREVVDALDAPPTHLFIQAGVGGIAAALAAYFAGAYGPSSPRCIVVEPDRAACLSASATAGRAVEVAPGAPTVMAMLECYAPSLTAFDLLSRLATGFMTVSDEEDIAALRRLADPVRGDPAIVAGESGAAGLAGLLQAAADPEARAALGLDAGSRVLLVATEGATDPERYAALLHPGP
ncbi:MULTISPECIES: diaminopropionate ammonia-lyase [unclassified Xanthobacter]|uniref:diaminopropionate ammonia-lyase n=1 Tax=unclassified Xanthobacter TaxID=2623496 RepID=UPI001EDDD972|nr:MULTISPECIES: diaminopropionate ammonia-lyase [unclassified Xanthobacter]